jgi:hypothetical protein
VVVQPQQLQQGEGRSMVITFKDLLDVVMI